MLGSFAVLVGLYLAVCVLARVSYRALLYPAPRSERPLPPGAALVVASTDAGISARGWLFSAGSADAGRVLVVHFHGNGNTMGDDVGHARALVLRGFDVLLVEYRGYGASAEAGSPTEQGLYDDAAALLDRVGVPPERTVLWGTSLGTGVATEMAARGRGRALVLVAPFTSIPDIGRRVAPFLPVGLIVGDHFDSRAKAPSLSLPVLIVHGDADEVVPYDMGKTLSTTFPHAKLVTVPGGHHNDLFVTHGQKLYDDIAAHAK